MRNLLSLYGGNAISAPDYVDSVVLAQNVQKTVDVPTNANFLVLNSPNPVWAAYVSDTDGYEVVANGTFATDAQWTKGGTWTIAGGVATRTASATGTDLEQAVNPLMEGQAYETKITVTATASTVTLRIGGTAGLARGAGTHTETLVAGNGGDIVVRATATFAGTVDDVSVKPVAAVPAADNANGTASELLTPVTNGGPIVRAVSAVQKISLICAVAGNTPVSLAYFR